MERYEFKRKYGSVKRQVIQQFVVEPVVGVIVHSIGQTIAKAVTVRHSIPGQHANTLLENTSSAIDAISPDVMEFEHDDKPNNEPKGRPGPFCC